LSVVKRKNEKSVIFFEKSVIFLAKCEFWGEKTDFTTFFTRRDKGDFEGVFR
jgi:hypothetical protein